MKKIVLIEDDSDLFNLLKYNLEKEGFGFAGVRIHPTIVVGWERDKGAYAPLACVGRSPDGDGKRLLL
jgi:hypothetical protein